MIKILSIAPYAFLPYSSGGQKLIAEFNTFLGKECDLTVVSTIENDVALAEHYRLLPWMKKGWIKFFDISLYFKLRRFIQQNNIAHLNIEHPYMGWLGYLLQKFCNIPLALHTHNIESERFKALGKKWWPILRFYERWILQHAAIVFCISEEDKQFMVSEFGIDANKCYWIPFGILQESPPKNKAECRRLLGERHHIPAHHKILLFTGVLNYKPNADAVKAIVFNIFPILQQQSDNDYTIIICGKNLEEDETLTNHSNIIFTGFVPTIAPYFIGADAFLNPVISGGGVKTKLIEAIGFNTTAISAKSGATGCDTTVCGDQLYIIADGDWNSFVAAIAKAVNTNSVTPNAYYETYFWGNIVKKVRAVLTQL